MRTLMFVLLSLVLIACQKARQREEVALSPLARQGKEVFEAKECGKCHYVGDEVVSNEAPSLLDPFLANDSLFVATHLRFVEQTKMPPVELTPEEIHAVSRYVAELHRAHYRSALNEDADTVCPVCYAPVNSEKARSVDLWFQYLGQTYYFECQKCLATFKEAPTAFVELLRRTKS